MCGGFEGLGVCVWGGGELDGVGVVSCGFYVVLDWWLGFLRKWRCVKVKTNCIDLIKSVLEYTNN